MQQTGIINNLAKTRQCFLQKDEEVLDQRNRKQTIFLVQGTDHYVFKGGGKRGGRLGNFQKLNSYTAKTAGKKIMHGEPWGRKIKQALSTNQVLCYAKLLPIKKNHEQLKVRKVLYIPENCPTPPSPLPPRPKSSD